MTPTPPPAPVDLDGLAAELGAAGIPFIAWGSYIHVASLEGIDVYPNGDVFVGVTRIESDGLDILDLIRRHTQPTEGASACGSSSHDQERSV